MASVSEIKSELLDILSGFENGLLTRQDVADRFDGVKARLRRDNEKAEEINRNFTVRIPWEVNSYGEVVRSSVFRA